MSFYILTDYEILMFRLQIITAKNTTRKIYDTHYNNVKEERDDLSDLITLGKQIDSNNR